MGFEERIEQPAQHFTKHVVKAMGKALIQRCEICGEIISDYRFVSYPKSFDPPKGFPEGNVFITLGEPKYSTVILSPEDTHEDCKIIN